MTDGQWLMTDGGQMWLGLPRPSVGLFPLSISHESSVIDHQPSVIIFFP
jgi:hypothetical protein